jgi:hypothetical protein
VHNEGGNEHRVFEVVKRAITQTGGVLISSDSCTKQLFKDPFPSHDLDNQDASQFTKRLMEGEEDISLPDAKFQIDVTEPKLESLVSGVVTILEFITTIFLVDLLSNLCLTINGRGRLAAGEGDFVCSNLAWQFWFVVI